ncbi:MAG TPA: hypothetical protein VL442_03350 [Mucilaginibacter sp.]|nr:hypothetical protein [Mucilaginibacter sp.]
MRKAEGSEDLKKSFFRREKGASGSWAEPCFACPTLLLRGFAYPPGILEAAFSSVLKENRILTRIPYIQIR